MKNKIFILFFLAFLIRFIAIDQSLWLDEAVTANVVSNFSYSEIITKFSPTDFHPPLFYLVEKFWTNIFGYSEIALRFPSIIFSLLTGWIIYLIGKGWEGWKVGKLEGRNIGLWGAALFLFNPLIIYYSQEARQYSMITMLTTLIIYYLLAPRSQVPYGTWRSGVANSSKSNSSIRNDFLSWSRFASVKSLFDSAKSKIENNLYFRDLFLSNLFIFLSLLTFYGSIFFIAAIYLWLLIKKEFKLLFSLLPGLILAVLMVFPLFIQQYTNSQIILSSVKNWSLVLGQANLKNLLLIPIKFSIGRISFEPKIIYWIVSGLWTTLLFSFILRPKMHLRGAFFLALFFVPLVIGLIASFFTPLLQYFRFLYLIPVFSLLIVLGMDIRSEWQKFLVVGGFLIFSFIYLLNPAYHKEDWKSLVKDLKTKTIYMIPSSSDAVKYYDKTVEIKDLKSLESLVLENNLTVIPYTSEIHGINYAEILENKGYKLDSERSYRELKVEEWNKVSSSKN